MVVWVGNGMMRGLEAYTTGCVAWDDARAGSPHHGLGCDTGGTPVLLSCHGVGFPQPRLLLPREPRSYPPKNAAHNLQSAICNLLSAIYCLLSYARSSLHSLTPHC